jgi:hypothetical protein
MSHLNPQGGKNMVKRFAVVMMALALVAGWGFVPATAYMCEAMFSAAEERIKEAEGKIQPDTDVRVKQKLAEAKGLLESAKIGHRQAGERHTGPIGKYSHGDAVRQARWAESLATEVIFLATGQPR